MKLTSGAGSSIRRLQLHTNYGRSDRPGVFTLIRFESADQAQVREMGTGNIEIVPTSVIKPLRNAPERARDDIKDIDEEKWKDAERKHNAIKELTRLRRIPKTLWDETAKAHGTTPKTLRKWLNEWRLDPRMSSMFRKRRSDAGGVRLDPFVEERVEHYLEKLRTNSDLQISDIMEDLDHDIDKERRRTKNKQIKTPAITTLYKRWHSISELYKAEGRIGAKKARQQYGLVRGSLLDVDHPLATVQVDHLELPVIIVDEETRIAIRRAWITVLIDVFSRMVCGYYITLEAPGNLSLGLAVVNAVLPKTDVLKRLPYPASWPIAGLPWQLHADNAGEFQGNMLEWAAKEYEFEIVFRKVKEPQYGGYIESYLGTLSNKLRHIPGATREGTAALEGSNPSNNAELTLSELDGYILNVVVQYHHESHSGLNDMPPIEKFREGMRGTSSTYPVGELLIPDDAKKLMLDFLPPIERTVGPQGVLIDYIHYMDDVLQRWVGAREPNDVNNARLFLFRIDPRDITRLYFWEPEKKSYFIIPTRNILRPSMSTWEYQAIRQFLKERGVEKIDEDIIFNAREERRRILADAKSATKIVKHAREGERYRRAQEESAKFLDKVSKQQTSLPESPPASSTTLAPPPSVAPELAPAPPVMDWGDP